MITFWHEWMLCSLVSGRAAHRVAVFVLRQPRNERSVKLVESLGFSVILGDRDNAYGVRQIRRFLEQDKAVVAVTLDGPSGPRRVAKRGVVRLARLARAPLHPVDFSARALFRLSGWNSCVMPDAKNQFRLRILPAVPAAAPVADATRALQDALSSSSCLPASPGVSDWPARAWALASTMPLQFGATTLWPERRSRAAQDGLELRG
jgi:lysophospholipid acyltransferase (LPLAT)-like uncharacterized protein